VNKLEVYWYVLIGAGIFLAMWVLPSLPIYEGSENCSPAFESRFFGQCYSPKTPFPFLMSLLIGTCIPIIIRITKKRP